jgi:type I restriction enzyme M protein
MSDSSESLTRIEVARAAGVEPPALNNWVRRHPSFPTPQHIDGQDRYSATAMAAWLDQRRIPSNALHGDETAGTTYGQRFRRNRGLDVPRAIQAGEALTTDVWPIELERTVWQPLERCRGNADIALFQDLVLSLLDLRYTNSKVWTQLTQTSLSGLGASFETALRKHDFDRFQRTVSWTGRPREILSPGKFAELIHIIDSISERAIQGASGSPSAMPVPVVFNYLLEKFAATKGSNRGAFFTPPSVVRTMIEIVDPQRSDRVLDPCCGSGEFLAATAAYIQRSSDPSATRPMMQGLALGERSWRLATLNAAIHGIAADIRQRWTPLQLDPPEAPEKYDAVFLNPPFNMAHWTDQDPALEPYWHHGPPPKNNANFAWLQHGASMLSPPGRAAVLMANGASSSANPGEQRIRQSMIETGVIRSIIALPPQLFHETSIPVSLWILGPRTPEENRPVLFIDASACGHLINRTHRVLSDTDRTRIVRAYQQWDGGEHSLIGEVGFAAIATVDQIRAHDYRLNPGAYVGASPPASIDADDTLTLVRDLHYHLSDLEKRADDVDAALEQQLRRLNAWTR